MGYKIKVSKLATFNIENAIEFYQSKSQSSARNFKKRLLEAYRYLEINPFFIVKYRNVRSLPLKKFPFLILFDIDEKNEIINVLSVFNTYQNPEKYP